MTKFNLQNYLHLDAQEINEEYVSACIEGNLDVVKNLLTHPKLPIKATPEVFNHEGFRSAAMEGHLDVVKYLLTSPDVRSKPSVHIEDDYALRYACENNHLRVAAYLVQEHAADDTPSMREFIKTTDFEIKPQILSLIDGCKLKRQINKMRNEDVPKFQLNRAHFCAKIG